MASDTRYPPVIFTDDGWILSATEPPVTRRDLRQKMVESYAGTGGALWWSVGDHEVYHYETDVGEIFGESIDAGEDTQSFVHSATPGVEARIAANVRALMASDGGPLTALTQLCREAGLPFLPRVRMNSHYVIDPAHPGYGRFRRQHPDLLIGRPGEDIPEDTVEWGIRTGLNYAFAEIRSHMTSIVFELLERFDVDGVELDFMRHPAFFRIEEAYAHRYLMTDLVRRVRRRMDELSVDRAVPMTLAVRVPPTLADSTRIGLDVAAWIEDNLIDIVVVGGGFIPFDTPVDEFVAAAEDSECLVYGCIEATRYVDEPNLRALAARWWNDGADGIYLYNFYTMSAAWNERTFRQLSSPAASARLDKRYELDRAGPFTPCQGHSCAFRYASPSTQLPVALSGRCARGPVLSLAIADDLDGATQDAVLGNCQLALRLDSLAPGDQLDVHLNGENLAWHRARVRRDGWTRQQIGPQFWMHYPVDIVEEEQSGVRVEFDIGVPPLKEGTNEVEVRLAAGDSEGGSVTLENVEIAVAYRDDAG